MTPLRGDQRSDVTSEDDVDSSSVASVERIASNSDIALSSSSYNPRKGLEIETSDRIEQFRDEECSSVDENLEGIPSNETLLLTAFATFMGFSSLQLIFAFIAGSQAMKGDSAAMIVDSVTYLFNYVAEVRKRRYDEKQKLSRLEPTLSYKQQHRQRRRMTLQLETVPPLISVATLLAVTAVIMRQSLLVLVYHQQGQGVPNLVLMLTFSIGNLFLDFLNVGCFASAKHALGYATDTRANYYQHIDEHSEHSQAIMQDDIDKRNQEEANLNMCSAYTHVFADTLRSIAVITAAAVAELVEGVSASEADAMAAMVVSILILLSLFPLLQGIYTSSVELRGILAEERDEQSSSIGDEDSVESSRNVFRSLPSIV